MQKHSKDLLLESNMKTFDEIQTFEIPVKSSSVKSSLVKVIRESSIPENNRCSVYNKPDT